MDNTENNSYEIQEMNESAEHSHSGSRVHADSFLGEEGGISDAEKPKGTRTLWPHNFNKLYFINCSQRSL